MNERRTTNFKDRKIKLIDLSFLKVETNLIDEKVSIVNKIKEILGDKYNEVLPYGTYLSNQKSKNIIFLILR